MDRRGRIRGVKSRKEGKQGYGVSSVGMSVAGTKRGGWDW